ncbi:hypothetical protein QFZ20_000144 [Flavobacterium sp. W4I14]|nr:hypothetical protein [Flavobacterium sp. W4I14]
MANLPIKEFHFGSDIRYLSDLKPFKTNGLLTNYIYFKILPGFGATRKEIETPRHSIILEPLVEVIVGKKLKHPNILAVYKKTKLKEIRDYLNDDSIKVKKVMVTPESYTRVKHVIESLNNKFDLYKDFFMLFDECERLITDKDYRGKIVLPMNDFFKFKNKALISATAILPSDKRFAENGFKIGKFIPDFDYKQSLNLIKTNNIVNTLKMILGKMKERPIFIFLNSTLTIHSVIKLCGLEENSKVFCSEDSRLILEDLGFNNTSSTLEGFARYNFFTCRFFSGLDIDLDFKPDVIMITDVNNATHSIIDPITEAIQITGRFRKAEGSNEIITTNSISHITNFKPTIKFRTVEDTQQYLNGLQKAYIEKRGELEEAECKEINNPMDEANLDSLKKGLSALPFNEFMFLNGEIDYYMVDNFIHKQRVKNYYINSKNLRQAYDDSNYFNVKEHTFDSIISDEENIKLSLAKTKIEQTKRVADMLLKLSTRDNRHLKFNFTANHSSEIENLRTQYPEIANAFFTLGYKKMEERGFKFHKINQKVDKAENDKLKLTKPVFDKVQGVFLVGKFYTEEVIKTELSKIYLQLGISGKAFPRHLKTYFKISDRTQRGKQGHGHEIIEELKH